MTPPTPRKLAPWMFSALTLLALESIAAADCPSTAIRWASTSQRVYITGPVACTLTDIDARVPDTVLMKVDATRKIWLLRVNTYLQEGATLVLHGSPVGGDVDELRLKSNDSSEANSIIMIRGDVGSLDIDSTKITSWDEVAGGPDTQPVCNGRSFIGVRSRLDDDGVTAHEARMDIKDSDVGYLGYDAAESYGLVWKVYGTPSAALYATVNVVGDVTGSHIHHNWFGAYTYGAYGMTWSGNEFDHDKKYGLDPHDDSDYLTVTDNDLHDNGDHGFICSQRCDHLQISGNRSWNNIGNGFMIHRSVTDTVIEDNEAWDNTDAGLAIFDSSGNVVRQNDFHDNRRGIRLSVGSSDNLIENNDLTLNETGFYLYKGSDPPTTGDGHPANNTFADNVLTDNPVALQLETSDENTFTGNTFAYASVAPASETFKLTDGVDNVLSDNVIPPDARIHTKTSALTAASTIITQPSGALLTDVSGSAQTIFRETSAVTHMLGTKITIVTPSAATLTLGSMSAATVTPVPIYAKPASGSLELTPTGTRSWKVRSPSGTVTVTFTVGKLTAGAVYDVSKNGVVARQVTAGSTGVATFSESVGSTSVTYALSAH